MVDSADEWVGEGGSPRLWDSMRVDDGWGCIEGTVRSVGDVAGVNTRHFFPIVLL